MTEQVKQQIIQVRDSGLTNMFDIPAVKWIAIRLGLAALAHYLGEDNTTEYAHFILTGESGQKRSPSLCLKACGVKAYDRLDESSR